MKRILWKKDSGLQILGKVEFVPGPEDDVC
jgi:hypothetical protein